MNTDPPLVHDVPYESAAPNAYQWTSDAYDLLVAGKLRAEVSTYDGIARAVATGECPRCRHPFVYTQVLQAVVGESLRTLGAATGPQATYIALTVPCQCSQPHAGRPAGVDHGCGINFRIEVKAAEAGA